MKHLTVTDTEYALLQRVLRSARWSTVHPLILADRLVLNHGPVDHQPDDRYTGHDA